MNGEWKESYFPFTIHGFPLITYHLSLITSSYLSLIFVCGLADFGATAGRVVCDQYPVIEEL